MKAERLTRLFLSVRSSAVLLLILAALLILNVALPQEKTLGEAAFADLIRSGPAARFFLHTLGLGTMSTSPIFLGVMGLFFLNLILVLGARWRSIWRQARLRPRSEPVLRAWQRGSGTLTAVLPQHWDTGHVVHTLRGAGYQARKVGKSAVWGVRHRTAPLGFLVFHISFFLLCAGGLLIYYTRFVGDVVLTEGQEFAGVYRQVRRESPLGWRPDLAFRLLEVVPRFVAGQPLSLEAVFRFRGGRAGEERRSRVNHPARWGSSTVLVQQAGIAPVLWLQDPRGFTLDRAAVVAMTRGVDPTVVPLAEGTVEVSIAPMAPGNDFPVREDLPMLPVHLSVRSQGKTVFSGVLTRGDAATWPQGRLVMEDLNYWLGVQVVSERGGGLLIAGFVMGILGLIWRLLLYRREVAVLWDEESYSLAGRSEYFSWKFQTELARLAEGLSGRQEPGGLVAGPRHDGSEA